VQLAADGTVELMNGLSAQLLLPLVQDRNLDNLYEALRPDAPWTLPKGACGWP
jgi:hypothetical protein